MILGLDGHQCGDKLQAGLDSGALGGAVLTLRYRRPANLEMTAKKLAEDYPDSRRLIDPAVCYMPCPPRGLGNYPDYPFTFNGMNRRAFRGLSLSEWATQTLEYQAQLKVTELVGPGIPLESFDDYRSELNLDAYAASREAQQKNTEWARLPLLLSLALNEAALASFEATSDYLDLLTRVSGEGFYIVVVRDNDTDPQWGDATRASRLANLMYMIHWLTLNGYRIVYSYSDMVGLLATTAGASDLAAGWFGTTRQLYFGGLGNPRGGGGAPRPLYASRPLLSWLLVSTDLAALLAAGLTDDAVDSCGFDERVRTEGAGTEWARRTEVQHFWALLQSVEAQLTSEDMTTRPALMESLVGAAIQSATTIERARVRLEKRPTHLPAWLQAIQSFQSLIAEA